MSCAYSGPAMPKAAHLGTKRRNEIYFQQVKMELCSLWLPHPLSHLAFQREYHDIPSLSNMLQCMAFVVDKVAMQGFWMLVSEEADVPQGGQCTCIGRQLKQT